MRAYYFMFPFAAVSLLCSCDSAAEKKEVLAETKINLSENLNENLQTAKDLTSFNFREIVQEKLGIQDTSILNAITWVKVKQENSSSVSVELVLAEKALPYKKELEALFKDFTEHKLVEYKLKNAELTDAEAAADAYVRLLEKANIDTIWLRTSPNLKKFASKDDFNQTVQKRKKLFHPLGTKKVENRRVSSLIGADLKGDFCTITFVYQNGDQEEVTLEKIDGIYKLLGYQFLVIPR